MPISLIFPRHCIYYINFAEMQSRFVFCVFIGISLRILLSHFIQVYLHGDEFQIVLVIYLLVPLIAFNNKSDFIMKCIVDI